MKHTISPDGKASDMSDIPVPVPSAQNKNKFTSSIPLGIRTANSRLPVPVHTPRMVLGRKQSKNLSEAVGKSQGKAPSSRESLEEGVWRGKENIPPLPPASPFQPSRSNDSSTLVGNENDTIESHGGGDESRSQTPDPPEPPAGVLYFRPSQELVYMQGISLGRMQFEHNDAENEAGDRSQSVCNGQRNRTQQQEQKYAGHTVLPSSFAKNSQIHRHTTPPPSSVLAAPFTSTPAPPPPPTATSSISPLTSRSTAGVDLPAPQEAAACEAQGHFWGRSVAVARRLSVRNKGSGRGRGMLGRMESGRGKGKGRGFEARLERRRDGE